tara:strand:+ start:137 stop:442 length:306 start_codon:yes stop_codon:yes gene_type:complete
MKSKLLTEGERLTRESLSRSPDMDTEVRRCRAGVILGAVIAALGLAVSFYMWLVIDRPYAVPIGLVLFMGGCTFVSDVQWRFKMYKVSLYAKSLRSNSSGG